MTNFIYFSNGYREFDPHQGNSIKSFRLSENVEKIIQKHKKYRGDMHSLINKSLQDLWDSDIDKHKGSVNYPKKPRFSSFSVESYSTRVAFQYAKRQSKDHRIPLNDILNIALLAYCERNSHLSN